MVDQDTSVIRIGETESGETVTNRFADVHKEELTQAAKDLGFSSRAQAIRHWIEIGRKATIETDPRQNQTNPDTDAKTIRELVPKGEENAVDMRDELIEIIEEQILDVVTNDDKIKKSGWKVYRE